MTVYPTDLAMMAIGAASVIVIIVCLVIIVALVIWVVS